MVKDREKITNHDVKAVEYFPERRRWWQRGSHGGEGVHPLRLYLRDINTWRMP